MGALATKHQGDPAADPERFDLHGHASAARARWIAKTQDRWKSQPRISSDSEVACERAMAATVAEQRTGSRDAMTVDRSQALRDAAWQSYVERITNGWKAPA